MKIQVCESREEFLKMLDESAGEGRIPDIRLSEINYPYPCVCWTENFGKFGTCGFIPDEMIAEFFDSLASKAFMTVSTNREICRLLATVVGERGESEGAVDVVKRLIAESRDYPLRHTFPATPVGSAKDSLESAMDFSAEALEKAQSESPLPIEITISGYHAGRKLSGSGKTITEALDSFEKARQAADLLDETLRGGC